MKLIGLMGRKRSGKDTVFEILHRKAPQVVRVAFADGVKEEVAAAINRPVSYIEEHKTQLRLLLQAWGTEYRRNLCSPTYWIDRTRDVIQQYADGDAIVVLTDVRFPNEAALIQELGGTTVRVYRPGFDTSDDEHSSETALDDFKADAVIWNPGGLSELENRVDNYITRHGLLKPNRAEPLPHTTEVQGDPGAVPAQAALL